MSPAENIEPEVEEIQVQIEPQADVDVTVETAPEMAVHLASDDVNVTVQPREFKLNVDKSTPDIQMKVDSSPDIVVAPSLGTMGPPGPPGPPGPGLNYTHVQVIPLYLWDIVHNLGLFPSVTVVDTGGTEIIPDVQYIDHNSIRLYFQNPTSGKAYLN